MTGAMKIATMIVATGMLTTVLLPDRKTVPVLNALFGGLSRWSATNMGLRKG